MVAINIFLDMTAVLNIVLAVVSALEWSISFKRNHTRYRYLYVLWILVSVSFGMLYAVISMNSSVDYSSAPIYMLLIRPGISLLLASSAITSETMRNRGAGKVYADK